MAENMYLILLEHDSKFILSIDDKLFIFLAGGKLTIMIFYDHNPKYLQIFKCRKLKEKKKKKQGIRRVTLIDVDRWSEYRNNIS